MVKYRPHAAAICQFGLNVDGVTTSLLENALRELLLCRIGMETVLGRILDDHPKAKPVASKKNKAPISMLIMRFQSKK